MVHLWKRCDWIEHIVYWARVEFNRGGVLPKGELGSEALEGGPLTSLSTVVPERIGTSAEYFTTARLWYLCDANRHVKLCIRIAEGGSVREGDESSDFPEPEVATLEVSGTELTSCRS